MLEGKTGVAKEVSFQLPGNKNYKILNDSCLLLFKDVYYLYAYHIFLGYRDAWKAKKKFNWQKVIEFGIVYINDIRFSKEELMVDGDSWQADSSWVVGALGELISEATHNDLETIDPAILPSIKALLSLLIPKLNPINDFTEQGMNHPMYVLNSSAGKVLRGLLDYALHVARIGEYKAGELNWEPDIKALFQSAVDRQIKDAYILEGMYFSQFAYLDYAWLVDQLDQNLNRDKQSWLAFMGGFGFADPPNDLKLFYRLYPHYEKALDEELDYSDSYDQGLNKHLVSYFFWGYDTLETDGLLSKFLAVKDAESIGKFVDFIWRQEVYFDTLDESGKAKLEEVIMTLWTTVVNRFYSPDTEKENNLISGLTRLLMYAHELDDRNTTLTLQSIESVKRQLNNYKLIENLVALKDKGAPVKTAVHLADILNKLPFHDFTSDKENEEILSLVEFLFLNGQKDNANSICNKLAMQGHEFLNELYKKYNH